MMADTRTGAWSCGFIDLRLFTLSIASPFLYNVILREGEGEGEGSIGTAGARHHGLSAVAENDERITPKTTDQVNGIQHNPGLHRLNFLAMYLP